MNKLPRIFSGFWKTTNKQKGHERWTFRLTSAVERCDQNKNSHTAYLLPLKSNFCADFFLSFVSWVPNRERERDTCKIHNKTPYFQRYTRCFGYSDEQVQLTSLRRSITITHRSRIQTTTTIMVSLSLFHFFYSFSSHFVHSFCGKWIFHWSFLAYVKTVC